MTPPDADEDGDLVETKDLTPKRSRPSPPFEGLEPEDALVPGAPAGVYVVSRLIGAGGCGAVYAAEHCVLGRRVALKVLHRRLAGVPELARRFVLEARAVNLIRHPGIVDIHDIGALEDGRPFYAMELVEGTSLGELLAERPPLTPREAAQLLDPICEALAAAHAKGVIHRDVKASNVLVIDRGPERQVKLVDFGIAKILDPDPRHRGLTVQGQRLGTPHYMAPEQLVGEPVDARTDVYALGVLLFRMLTKEFPFHSADLAEIERMHLEVPPPAPSQRWPLPPAIDAVVLRALDKRPDRRFTSVGALRAALRQAIDAPAAAPAVSAAPAVAQGIGIYVEVRVPDHGGVPEAALLSELASMLDLAALVLGDAGFLLALQTGVSLLGTRSSALGSPSDSLSYGLIVARRVYDTLANRPDPDTRVRFDVSLHVDRANLQVGPHGKALLTGPSLQLGSWVPERLSPRAK